MLTMRKTAAWLLLVVLLFLTGCSGKIAKGSTSANSVAASKNTASDSSKASTTVGVSLACSITDSFNPYSAQTMINRNLSPLLYDSLVTLRDDFTPQNKLAQKITVDGTIVTVTLKSVSFSDGSSLTADDVVYCANKAMDSGTRYSYGLRSVSSVNAADAGTVVFKLKKEDPYFENVLDFPIYKQNADKKISSDNIAIPPIGCGRYIISDDKSSLVANKGYYEGTPKIKKITLVNTPDDEALSHNLEVGNITYYYSDLSDCTLPQVRGHYKTVTLNNLVYLGVNMKSVFMKNTEMRQAVSAAIDRAAIAENAYYGNAVAATGIYNPKWVRSNSFMQTTETKINEKVYLAQLKKIGYNKKDSSGYYVNSSGERLTLKLVCNKENSWRGAAAELVRAQLKDAGIRVTVESLSWSAYKSALKNGYFDLYLGEVRIGNNMDIGELVKKDGSAAYGITYGASSRSASASASDGTSSAASSTNTASGTGKTSSAGSASSSSSEPDYAGSTASAVSKFYRGKATAGEVASAFATELPIIPICYRTGIVSYSAALNNIEPSYSDPYFGLEK